jgi:hypothetical protein
LRFNELTNEEDNQQTQELGCVVVRERESLQMHKHHCQSQMNPHTCQQQELGLYKTHVIILSQQHDYANLVILSLAPHKNNNKTT